MLYLVGMAAFGKGKMKVCQMALLYLLRHVTCIWKEWYLRIFEGLECLKMSLNYLILNSIFAWFEGAGGFIACHF